MAEGTRNTGRGGKKPVEMFPDMRRLQPRARELEEAVLGALMLEKGAYSTVSKILKPECFYKKVHEKIYVTIVDLAPSQCPVDTFTVTEQLKKWGELEDVGGLLYTSQLTNKVASNAHIEYHAHITAQKYLVRELISFTAMTQEKVSDGTLNTEDLMQEAEGKPFEISQCNMRKDVTQINPVIKNAMEMSQRVALQGEGLSGLYMDSEGLDKMTSGWQSSDLIITAVRPATGKAAFVLSTAKDMAVNFNTSVTLFLPEMSNVQLVNRLIVNAYEIPGEETKSGCLKSYEWEQLDFRVKEPYDAPILVDDILSLSAFELRMEACHLVREYGIKCIIIDYFQLMNTSGMSFGSRRQEVNTISRSLKGLVKKLNTPIITLSQLNRGVEVRQGVEGRRPQLVDLRESGAIKQGANMVCFTHRPEYYRIMEDERGNFLIGPAEIIIAKHRNDAAGDVRLCFKSEFARLMNVEEDIVVRGFSSTMNGGDPMSPIPPAGVDFLSQDSSNEIPSQYSMSRRKR